MNAPDDLNADGGTPVPADPTDPETPARAGPQVRRPREPSSRPAQVAYRRTILATGILAAVLGGRAAASTTIEQLEPAPEVDTAAPRPDNAWSVGVVEAERHAAEALFFEGNRLMRESITITAAAKYREALGHWDHPNIHFNLAIALMTLDQPAETYEHLELAMRYGPGPLGQERFEHARNYLGLLDKQLARVNIRCAVPGAVVELDGQQLFAAPARTRAECGPAGTR